MKKQATLYTLTNENIDIISERIGIILQNLKAPSGEILKIRLKAEEAMRSYQEQLGADTEFSFRYVGGVSKHFAFRFPGKRVKPFSSEDDDEYLTDILNMLGKDCDWQYKHKTNLVDFWIPKKPFSQLLQIGIALLCVVAFYLLTRILPSSFVGGVREAVISPLIDIIVNVLRSAAGLLIFVSIALSIVNIGDIRSFKKMGKRLFLGGLLFLALNAAVSLACFSPWIHLSTGGTQGSDSFSELFATILAMIPGDPVSPFVTGNTMQIIVMAVFAGIILTILGDKVKRLRDFLQDCNTFFSEVLDKITLSMPVLIFLVLTNTLLTQDWSALLTYKTILYIWLVTIAVLAVMGVGLSALFAKCSPWAYLKKAKTPLLVALLTGSSVAAMPYNLDTCKKTFGMDEKLVELGVPIGQVMFMPALMVPLLAGCVGTAAVAGMEVSVVWLVTATVISILLSIAAPPVSGGAVMTFSLLFSQMGLPAEYLGITFAAVAIVENLLTMENSAALHSLLLWANRNDSE